jgi:hypothetical protein
MRRQEMDHNDRAWGGASTQRTPTGDAGKRSGVHRAADRPHRSGRWPIALGVAALVGFGTVATAPLAHAEPCQPFEPCTQMDPNRGVLRAADLEVVRFPDGRWQVRNSGYTEVGPFVVSFGESSNTYEKVDPETHVITVPSLRPAEVWSLYRPQPNCDAVYVDPDNAVLELNERNNFKVSFCNIG